MINIVIAFEPYAPLHFHAESVAASATTPHDNAIMSTTRLSLFIAILLKPD
jgi:hypothetical protein